MSPDVSGHAALFHLLLLPALITSSFYFLSLSATTEVNRARIEKHLNSVTIFSHISVHLSCTSLVRAALTLKILWCQLFRSDVMRLTGPLLHTLCLTTLEHIIASDFRHVYCLFLENLSSGLDLRFESSSHSNVFLEKQAAFITALGEQMFNAQGHIYPLLTAVASEFRRVKLV